MRKSVFEDDVEEIFSIHLTKPLVTYKMQMTCKLMEGYAVKIKSFVRRVIIASMVMILVIVNMTGCAKLSDMPEADGKLSIVCTTFPQYDWVRNIIKGKEDVFDVTLIMDNGADLHNYQPTTEDMIVIGASDIFVYVGGESDFWIDDALREASNKDMKIVNLMDILGDNLYEEEIIEGMTVDEHEHGDDEDETEYDEHIWLSLRNAEILVNELTDVIASMDEENASVYEENAKSYIEELDKLDNEYKTVVSEAKRNTLLFGDRFSFRYMVSDYGLDYYAAFNGCSAETEASFETITYLAGKLDEFGIPVVLVLENSDTSVAKAIIDNTKDKNQEILVLNSLQSVTTKDIEAGVTYLSVMSDNLQILKEALY